MNILKELTYIITKNKISKIEVLGSNKKKRTKVEEFYDSLISNDFDTDEEAAFYFYKKGKQDTNYKKLKSGLRNQLTNTLFFIDVKKASYTNQQIAYYTCCKEWAAAKILLGKEARKSGIYYCKRVLRKSLLYEFTDLIISTCKVLKLHYGVRIGNQKKFDYYNNLFHKYEKIEKAENAAEELYISLVMKYVNSRSFDDISPLAILYVKQVSVFLKKHDSYRLHLYGTYIKIMASTAEKNYKKTIEVCNTAICFFNQKAYDTKKPIQIFLHQQLLCYTQMKEYEKGESVAKKVNALLEKGSFDWFKHQELFFILSLHTKNYDTAYLVLLESINNKRLAFLNKAAQEMWKIYEAYIQFLITSNKITLTPHKTNFRLGKFLNEVPTLSKDKRGVNIPILVIQILFLLVKKEFDKIILRIEAIEKYCHRYLKKDETYRSNCFIKMLIEIPISSFHKAGLERKSARYLGILKETPLDIARQANEIEIIPYEDLWGMVIESLENKFRRVRSSS